MIGWFLVCVLAALTFYLSKWWGIVLAVMLFWQASQWHRYKSRPWRRIHFPAMVLWSGAAGLETSAAQKEGREYNPDIALQHFAKALNSQLSVEDSKRFVEKTFAEYKDLQFENVIRNKLVLSSAKVSPIDAEKVIAHVAVQFKNPELGLRARLIIAEAIKADAGEEEYIEYLRAILTHKAA